jgi:RNA polymerase sigma factor (sigma-70 family)
MALDPTTQPDGDLVAAFAADPAAREAAFAELVRRHGAMVLNTCRRIVGNGNDAEDAAQAVFLTLAHKAKALRRHPTLGGWLHRSARNISLRQRDALRTRIRHEGTQEARAMLSPPDGLDERQRAELREVLDGALDQLAERYRLPLVLHYLEGRTQDEVAQLLDLKPGTLASLLSRGRDQLRDLLQRKGVAVSAVALAALLAGEAHAATATVLPATLTLATAKAAGAIAAGTTTIGAGVSPQVAALTSGALKTMTILKLTGAAVAAALVLTIGATTAVTLRSPAAEPVAAVPAVPIDDASPEALVASMVRALRGNDLAAFWRRLPAEEQQRAQESYARLTGNQWMGPIVERLLAQATPEQITAAVVPALTKTDAAALATQLRQYASPDGGEANAGPGQGPGPGGFGFGGRGNPLSLSAMIESLTGNAVSGLLANGLETRQAQSIQGLLGGFADWAAKAPFADQAKASACATELGAAIEALGVKTAADLNGVTVGELVGRLGGGAKHLKSALAAYDLQVDAVLDTVKVIEVKPVPDATDSVVATLGFTAFGTARTLPLKLAKKDGHWTVANDSPLATWLGNRGPGMMGMLMFAGRTFGGGPGGGPGQRGPRGPRGPGGQGGQGQGGQGQGAAPEEKPTPNPGF